MMKKVVVIGAGFSGLSAACFLAKSGFEVTVLEKHEVPGGRCRVWEKDGFRFDMGPSWYWMPDVFERFFASFGKKVSDYYELERLDPSYKVVFPNEEWNIPAGTEALANMLEQHEKGAGNQLKAFLKEAEYKYETGINNLVYKPGRTLGELMDMQIVKGLFKLDLFKSMTAHLRRFFKDERIIQLLEFPVLFLGAKPEKTPALYSLMNYADIELGTWYPKGGMYEIVKGMRQLAEELGVVFHFNTEVQSIESTGRKVTEIKTSKGSFKADIVVGSADYNHIDTQLLKKDTRNYSDSYWEKRTMAPSSLLFYLGVNKRMPGMLHHTLFFDTDFKKHAEAIYDQPEWPEKPLFYVSCPSQTDTTVAPNGMENLCVLIPLAPGLADSEENREHYFNLIMDRMETRLGYSIKEHVIVKRSYAMTDFVSDYSAFKGNAYGLANTLTQTAHLKPSLKNKNLDNFYYIGQLTVPGPGVPPSLISGEVVCAEILKDNSNS